MKGYGFIDATSGQNPAIATPIILAKAQPENLVGSLEKNLGKPLKTIPIFLIY